MIISMTDTLFALSTALDSVEHQLLGAETYHAKRVAYLSILMGREFGLDDADLADLACAAVLHDNALSEYIASEALANVTIGERRRRQGDGMRDGQKSPMPLDDIPDLRDGLGIEPDIPTITKALRAMGLKEHCLMGERNIEHMPFYPRVKGIVLYHHENFDGSGPFKRKGTDIPLYARIIHLGDLLDVTHSFIRCDREKYEAGRAFVAKRRNSLFCPDVTDAFLEAVTYEKLEKIQGDHVIEVLRETLPEIKKDYTDEQIRAISAIFARITDYKSSFTRQHSMGIVFKASRMARYYALGEEMETKLYLTGALHDIGKLVIDNDILEKPGKLTDDEFAEMKNHAWFTWKILGEIKGFEDITRWASFHHEKLDGTGYPFGKHDYELNKLERLMGCIDIYQALTEERPYKAALSHEETMGIMRAMADQGKIDGGIVEDISMAYEQGLFVE